MSRPRPRLAVMVAAGAPAIGENNGAPASQPASTGESDASTTSPTTAASLKVNGNNPAQWQINQPWQDNLGALFNHDGQSETFIPLRPSIRPSPAPPPSVIPSSGAVLHITRDVVVEGAANDNPQPQ